MIRRRGNAADIPHMHAHRLRHTLSHVWQREQGNESDLMAIMVVSTLALYWWFKKKKWF